MHLLKRLLAAGPSCRPSGSRAFAAAATSKDPHSWVMLNKLVRHRGDADCADAGTMAEARSSTGRNLQVSLGRVAPPATSFLYCHWAGGGGVGGSVLAAHGDSILLRVAQEQQESWRTDDKFVYVAGAEQETRPPSLTPLPAAKWGNSNIGLLRRSEDELLAVQLHHRAFGGENYDRADLSMHRVGSGRGWEPRPAVPVVDGRKTGAGHGWHSHTTVTVGDRFMCWVDYDHGVLVCDMAEDGGPNKLRLTPMREVDDLEWERRDADDGYGMRSWNMGAAGTSALRYVSIDPRCCCGLSHNRSSCPRSRGLFPVATWTLDLETMAWVKESTLDCKELWAFPGYAGLPRVVPVYPVVSSADADVVCFVVRRHWDAEKKEWTDLWMLEVDTSKKVLLSVCRPWNNVENASLAHVPATL